MEKIINEVKVETLNKGIRPMTIMKSHKKVISFVLLVTTALDMQHAN